MAIIFPPIPPGSPTDGSITYTDPATGVTYAWYGYWSARDPGTPGATGATGPGAGDQGASGATGASGVQGATGSPGNPGPPGPPSIVPGPQGPTGSTGPQGPLGFPGQRGATGPQGVSGTPGSVGSRGSTGATGIGSPGVPGGPGATGPKGDTGNPGQFGPTGATGASGATGPRGFIGFQGPAGPPGATGPQGIKGDPDGATGPQGPQGIPGTPGPIGATGPVGATGPKGEAGDPGGATGSVGSTGATGVVQASSPTFSVQFNQGSATLGGNALLTYDGSTLTATNPIFGDISGYASRLQTPREINGIDFDGTSDITITALTDGTLTMGTSGIGLTGSATFFGDNATFIVDSNATDVSAPDTLVSRDSNSNFSAGTISADLFGNASSATRLETTRNINGIGFDGTEDITITALTDGTLSWNTAGIGISITGDTSFNGDNASFTINSNATPINLPNTIVSRNSSGNFVTESMETVGNVLIGGDLTVQGTEIILNTETLVVENKNIELGLVTTGSGPTDDTADGGGIELAADSVKSILWFKNTDRWTSNVDFEAANFYGNLIGNVSGNISGDLAGNADSATQLETARDINNVPFDGTSDITITALTDGTLTMGTSGNGLSGSSTFNGANSTFTVTSNGTSASSPSTLVFRDASRNFSANVITASLNGNSSSSTQLQNPRDINGVAFDGTSDITITANTPGTLTMGTLGGGISGSATFNGDNTTFTVNLNSQSGAIEDSVVLRDANGSFSANVITANQFNGSAERVGEDLTAGTDLTSTGPYNGSVARTFSVQSSSSSQANSIVKRDASQNFSAGTITANLTGTASNASVAARADRVAIAQLTNNTNRPFVFTNNTTAANNKLLYTDSATTCYINPSTNTIGATNFVGSLTGTASNAALLDNIDSSSFLRSDTGDIKTAGTLRFNDNVICSFGTGNDAEFFCNGTHMYLDLNGGIGNFYIRDGTTIRYTFNDNGSFTATGNVTAFSDEKLKKNWTGLSSDFVARLAEVKSGTYDRIDSGIRQAGVSAQALQEVLPEAVTDVDGTLAVSYGHAALVSSVELAKEVVELRELVKLLQKEVRELKESN